jgi:hypothetical protein
VGRRERTVRRWQVEPRLIYGQVKKSYRRRKLVRVTQVMRLLTEDADPRHLTSIRLLGTVEHGLNFAGQSDAPPWNSCAGASHLGDGSTVLTPARLFGMVACLLPFCPSPCSTAGAARAAARTRWQTARATRPPADASHGRRQNQPTMDDARGALLSLAAALCLSATQA